MSGRVENTSLNVICDDEKEHVPPNRHRLVLFTVYSEPVYPLLESGSMPDIMSKRLAEKLMLEMEPTNHRIVVANVASEGAQGVVNNVPVEFGIVVARLKFPMMDSVSFDLIISDSKKIKLRMKIDNYHSTMTVKMNGKLDTLNLQYEPKVGDSIDEELLPIVTARRYWGGH